MRTAAALLIGVVLGALFVRVSTSGVIGGREAAPASTPASSSAGPTPPVQDCAAGCDGGECVLGRCLRSGQCERDTDCDDANDCSVEWCEAGRCAGGDVATACASSEVDGGLCFAGFCERPVGEACGVDDDCGAPVSACLARACIEGRCVSGAREEGLDCVTAAGRPGSCRAGACIVGADRRLRFLLDAEELARIERGLETRLANNLRYDLHARLVPLHVGGFNIVLANRRSRAEVRGLCDPSFIAFDLADYTAGTNWKSSSLQVWLEPDRGGWLVPTRGSRFAVDQGRASSYLGALGVVDVRTLRIWLERSFVPLDGRPAVDPGAVVPLVAVAPLPERPDAGSAAPSPTARASTAATGQQVLSRAWDAYGDGRFAEARRLVAQARALGKRDRDLEELLADAE